MRDARIPEDGEPEDPQERRGEQCASHKFPDCAAQRNARHEHADKGGPADPPGPVIDRPVMVEAGISARDGVGQGGQIFQIGCDIGADISQKRQRCARCENEQQQGKGDPHVKLAQNPDAAINPAPHRQERYERHDRDEPDNGERRAWNAIEIGDPSHRLLRTKAKRCRKAKDRREDGQNLDPIPRTAPDRFPQQGVKGRPYRERQIEIISKDRKRKTHHGEDGPRVERPIKDRRGHGEAARLCRIPGRTTEWRRCASCHGRHKVGHRFSHAVKDKANAHACAKQHRKP